MADDRGKRPFLPDVFTCTEQFMNYDCEGASLSSAAVRGGGGGGGSSSYQHDENTNLDNIEKQLSVVNEELVDKFSRCLSVDSTRDCIHSQAPGEYSIFSNAMHYSSSPQLGMYPFYDHLSTMSNQPISQCNTRQSKDEGTRLIRLNNEDYASTETEECGPYPIKSYLSSDQTLGLNSMCEILNGEDDEMKGQLIFSLQGSYCILMINSQTLFQSLLDACNDKQLSSVVEDVLSDKMFVRTASYYEGKHSIMRLIRKLKRTHHAFTLTKLLSTMFWDLTTNYTAVDVIKQCLLVLGDQPNKILYEKTIEYSKDLATDRIGCTFLNDCVSTIAGEQRLRLLTCIADESYYLSQDPFGNYVVQRLLSLQNDYATNRILSCLQGQFVQLALLPGGSHIVEQCIGTSQNGTIIIVKEILNTPKAPSLLAQHPFGNYVIQTALLCTKKQQQLIVLYESLIGHLLRHKNELHKTPGGKCVMKCIKQLEPGHMLV